MASGWMKGPGKVNERKRELIGLIWATKVGTSQGDSDTLRRTQSCAKG